MNELKQIKSVLNPDETLLVVDAMTGQEAATLTARFDLKKKKNYILEEKFYQLPFSLLLLVNI